MSETTDPKFLDTFPAWLRSLGDDAEALGGLLAGEGLVGGAREAVVGGLTYLFKSLDLIPDGIDDIGFLDDAFVLRIAADLAIAEDGGDDPEVSKVLGALANDCELLREFLGDDYGRLESYVKGLRRGSARGRSVADVLGEPSVRAAFLGDVTGFAKNYVSPSFTREEKTLIKLRAFFDAKLPR